MSPKIRVTLFFIGMSAALILLPAVHRSDRAEGTAEPASAIERQVKDRPAILSAKAEDPDIPGIALQHSP